MSITVFAEIRPEIECCMYFEVLESNSWTVILSYFFMTAAGNQFLDVNRIIP